MFHTENRTDKFNDSCAGTEKNTGTFWPMGGISVKCILTSLYCSKQNEINILLSYSENHGSDKKYAWHNHHKNIAKFHA